MSGGPPSKTFLAVARLFNEVRQGLFEILEIDLHRPEPHSMEVFLSDRFESIADMALRRNPEASFDLEMLHMLYQNLLDLRKHRRGIFTEYKSQFHQINRSQYFGWRFEVDTAAFLTRKAINFTHPDPPDFRISWGNDTISIECTTLHYESSSISAAKKINDKILEKSNNEYVDESTALCLYYTNVIYTGMTRGEFRNIDSFKQWILAHVDFNQVDFGSVIFMGYHVDPESVTYRKGIPMVYLQHGTDRIDNNPSEELLNFLRKHIAFGEGQKKKRWFPDRP